jgi:hypothetical protein
MEIGLYGSPLKWSYEEYSPLTTEATWCQNLWQLVHVFEVNISSCDADMVNGVRKNDRSLMSEFSRIGYKGKDLAGLNIAR